MHKTNLTPGQLCILPPQKPRQIRLDTPGKVMLLQLSDETIVEATQGELRSPQWQLTNEYAVSDPTIVMMAKELRGWLAKKDVIAALYRRTLIRLLCVHLIAKYAQADIQIESGDEDCLHNAKLAPVIRYIKSHLDKDLKVKVLAAMAGLSPSHFSRMFKRSVGVTPHQYILSQRINLARSLLNNPQISLSEISFRCGFYDQSHFILQFRRFTGTTPKAYRESNEEKGAYF